LRQAQGIDVTAFETLFGIDFEDVLGTVSARCEEGGCWHQHPKTAG
jgi:hypothetical protein